MKLFLTLFILPAIFSSLGSSQQCGKNEMWNQCGGRCELNCGDPENKPCPFVCDPPKCTCKSGFRRNPLTGKCVRPSQCLEASDDANVCGMNEKFVQCPPRCEPSCTNPNANCPPVCGNPGCVCNIGYVRAPKSNECIKPSECFSSGVPNKCQKNEAYVTCSTPCEPTCEDPNPACARRCDGPKCQCATGYVRNTQNGECILPSQCQKNPPNTVTCQNNEIYVTCSNPCEPSCNDRHPACARKCGMPKCECKKGFFRNTMNGECVSELRCPIGARA